MHIKIFDNIKHSENDNVTGLKGLRKRNLPYIFIWMVYYAWVVAFATWWTASPLSEHVFGSNIRSLMHLVNLFSSAVFILIIKKEWFIKMSRIGAVCIIAGMSVFLLVPSAAAQLISAIIIAIFLGCVNTSILMPFVFSLNNTEKLYAVVGSNLLISLISLFQNSSYGNNLKGQDNLLLSFVILIIALSSVLFFKKEDILPEHANNNVTTPKIPSRIYLLLFFNCAFAILGKGVGTGVLNITAGLFGNSVIFLYYIGGLVGCLIFFSIYALTSKAFVLLGNIGFAFISMGFFCNAFAAQAPQMVMFFAVFLGVGNSVGMINLYYIIGIIGRKYQSMRYLKMSIIFIGIFGGASGVAVGNLIHVANTSEIALIASLISVSVLMLFMIFSPLFVQEKYYSDWARDSSMMEIDNEHLYLFKEYQLSKREIEVCKLLIQGYTLRQISAMLSIAYSTVNTHCTCVYRKLNINSRAELLILFKDYIVK